MTEQTKTDEAIVKDVEEALQRLNRGIRAAVGRGIEVKADVLPLAVLGVGDAPVVTVSLRRVDVLL